MSIAPRRFCAQPSCSARVQSGYCPAHQPTSRAPRVGAHAQGYTRQWERFRRETFPSLLVEAGIIPACGARLAPGPSPHSLCAASGFLETRELQLDHDPPLETWERQHPERVCDPYRVAYLCRADHSAKTNTERAGATGGGLGKRRERNSAEPCRASRT